MNAEIFSTLSIILICWIALTAANTIICLILKLSVGVTFKKAFLWGCLALILPPSAIAYGSLIERNLFKIKKVEIVCSGLPEGFDGYRIVHISDIHARSFEGRGKYLQNAVEKINSLEADIVAFTGDLITMAPDELDGLSEILSGIKSSDGVFSILGNHDYSMYSDMGEEGKLLALERLIGKERAMGWNLLMNSNAIICRGRDSLAIVGVENTSPSRHFPSKGKLTEAAAGTDGMFRILLSHDPLHWESEVVDQDFPLTLSGHTHSMQFSLLGWSPSRYMFPQYRGLYSTKSGSKSHIGTDRTETADSSSILEGAPQYLYVNAGLGETIFPARIGVRPEITLITLRRK